MGGLSEYSHPIGVNSNIPPLRDKLLFRGSDVDEMCARIGDVIRPHHVQVARKAPQNVNTIFHHAPLSQVSVNYLYYGFDAKVKAERLGAYLIEIPLSGASETACGNHHFSSCPGKAAIVNPDQAFHTEWTPDCSKLLIKIDKPALEHYLGTLLGNPIHGPLDFEMGVDLDSPAGASLSNTVRLLMAELENPQSLLHTASLAHGQYEQMLMWSLLHAQPHNYSNKLQEKTSFATPHHVRRVVEYIEEYCAEPITLEELIGISGVSERTLFDAFRRYKDISPMKYLKKVRMEKVYRALLTEKNGNKSVTEIAEAWGFTQLGRFSVEYKQRYGESPSETLRR